MKTIPWIGWGLFWVLSILVGILAFRFVPYGFFNGFLPSLELGFSAAINEGIEVGIRKDFKHIYYHVQDRLTPLLMHILIGTLPIFLIPFQLWRGFRARHSGLHRWMGRIALVGIILSAWGSVNLAVAMDIPAWGQAGFVIGAGAWVGAAIWGIGCAIRGKMAAHQDWMVIVAAMTFGAVMIRLEFPIWRQFFAFDVAYACAAWSSWVLNVFAVLGWRYAKRGTFGMAH